MRILNIDDDTYAAWQQCAAACGLSVEEWLKQKIGHGNANGRTVEELTPTERVERMRAFWSTLKGRGGTADVDRDNIYG